MLVREPLAMAHEGFAEAFRGSPMEHAKLCGLKRNVAVVLGNVGGEDYLAVLERALDDLEPLVREHTAWALGRAAEPWAPPRNVPSAGR